MKIEVTDLRNDRDDSFVASQLYPALLSRDARRYTRASLMPGMADNSRLAGTDAS
jgi:hypothetical protein